MGDKKKETRNPACLARKPPPPNTPHQNNQPPTTTHPPPPHTPPPPQKTQPKKTPPPPTKKPPKKTPPPHKPPLPQKPPKKTPPPPPPKKNPARKKNLLEKKKGKLLFFLVVDISLPISERGRFNRSRKCDSLPKNESINTKKRGRGSGELSQFSLYGFQVREIPSRGKKQWRAMGGGKKDNTKRKTCLFKCETRERPAKKHLIKKRGLHHDEKRRTWRTVQGNL